MTVTSMIASDAEGCGAPCAWSVTVSGGTSKAMRIREITETGGEVTRRN